MTRNDVASMLSNHGLGRKYDPDPNDMGFLMSRFNPKPTSKLAAAMPIARTWTFRGDVLDQDGTGECVGHGWEHYLHCAPLQTKHYSHEDAELIYKESRTINGWDPNDLQDGSTVRAGAQAVSKRGALKSYLWAFTARDAAEWIATKGPVVLGTNWYDSMFSTNAEGFVSISKTATVAGGHCYLWRGIDFRRGIGELVNSWSKSWGKRGHFYMSLETIERLIHENGEACTAVQQKVSAAA